MLDANQHPLTNSVLEAHRINSPYILEGQDRSIVDELTQLGSPEQPIDLTRAARLLLRLDPNSLLHGVFIAKKEILGGRIKIPRSLSGFIEASGVGLASSGGVKIDRLNPSGETAQGFGHVPFARDEFTARRITGYFNLDLAQLRGYRLGDAVVDLLTVWALYKIQRFLAEGLRLRTACDLTSAALRVTRPAGFAVPSLERLAALLPELIAGLSEQQVFAKPPVTDVVYRPKPKAESKAKQTEAESDSEESE